MKNICKKFKIIDSDSLNFSQLGNILYVIGNGFDLAHGVKSTYKDFRNFLGKRSELKEILEFFINKKDIWGNFEDSLAHIDREKILYGLDLAFLEFDVKEDDDDDFSAANYHLAIEHTLEPVFYYIQEVLPNKFRWWVKKLRLPNNYKKPFEKLINKNAYYINFNYTEFLEEIYGVAGENILYIHGLRKNKKDKFILGHGEDADRLFEEWAEKNKNMEITSDNIVSLAYFSDDDNDEDIQKWGSASRYYAAQDVVQKLESYYEDSAKKTEDVIEKNQKYFEKLKNIDCVIVLGHSLSNVDYAYFQEIISKNKNIKNLKWIITYYDKKDILRIDKFAAKMHLKRENISIICTCENKEQNLKKSVSVKTQ